MLTLTPAYDLVAAGLYPEHCQLALAIGTAANLTLEALKPKHLVALSNAYGLDAVVLENAIGNLDRRLKTAEKAVVEAAKRIGEEHLGQRLFDLMERRWNGSFNSIGRFLSKKRSGADDK